MITTLSKHGGRKYPLMSRFGASISFIMNAVVVTYQYVVDFVVEIGAYEVSSNVGNEIE